MDIDALHQQVTQLQRWKDRVSAMLEEMLPQWEDHVRLRGDVEDPSPDRPQSQRPPAFVRAETAASAAAQDQRRREAARLAQEDVQRKSREADEALALSRKPTAVTVSNPAPTEPGATQTEP